MTDDNSEKNRKVDPLFTEGRAAEGLKEIHESWFRYQEQSRQRDWWDWIFLQMGVFPEPYPTHLSKISDDLGKEVIDLGYDLRRPNGDKIDVMDYWRT